MKPAAALTLLALAGCVSGEGFIWQGFDHRWLRRVVGFETPHRLGSVANYLMSNGSGWYSNMTFTPGVDGDYAHPETFYTELPEGMVEGEVVVETTWNDALDNSTYPSATSEATKQFTIPMGAAAVLKGIRLDMHCDPSLQPANNPCNGNGDWLSYFNISQSCPTSTSCSVTIRLTRAWTPSHGGGKSINSVMSYHAYIPVQTLTGLNLKSHTEQRLVKSGVTTTTEVTEETKYIDVPSESSVLVGVSEITFQLFETDGYKDLGRYLERFAFHVGPFSRVWPSTTLEVNYKLGVTSPVTTTYKSNFTTTLTPQIITWRTPSGMYPIPQKHAEGTTCFSGFGFSCKDHFLKDTTNDVVALKN